MTDTDVLNAQLVLALASIAVIIVVGFLAHRERRANRDQQLEDARAACELWDDLKP